MAENVEHAKSGLGGVQKTAEDLYNVIAAQSEVVAANEDVIDVGCVRQIEEASLGLQTLYEVVRDILAVVDSQRLAAAQKHREIRALIRSRLQVTGKARQAPPGDGAAGGAGSGAWNKSPVIRGGGAPPAPPPAAGLAPPRPVERVDVAPGIQLEACIIPRIAGGAPPIIAEAVCAQVRTPQLHYYPPWGHFLLRVGSVVLHGGIGEVFDDRRKSKSARRQVRTTACRNADCSGKTCPFYHCPAAFEGSREVRNYSQNSWLYSPDFDSPDAKPVRRLGSASRLPTDLKTMRPQDAVLLADQAMMSLLLALVACKYRAAPR